MAVKTDKELKIVWVTEADTKTDASIIADSTTTDNTDAFYIVPPRMTTEGEYETYGYIMRNGVKVVEGIAVDAMQKFAEELAEYTNTKVDYLFTQYVKPLIDEVSKKYTKPSTGIPALDLADGVIPDVSGFATVARVAALATDLTNLEQDVEDKDRAILGEVNTKYTLPEGGIPTGDIANGAVTYAKLSESVQDTIDNALTAEQITPLLNAKYTKPSTGIPTGDIANGAITANKIADGVIPDVSGFATAERVSTLATNLTNLEQDVIDKDHAIWGELGLYLKNATQQITTQADFDAFIEPNKVQYATFRGGSGYGNWDTSGVISGDGIVISIGSEVRGFGVQIVYDQESNYCAMRVMDDRVWLKWSKFAFGDEFATVADLETMEEDVNELSAEVGDVDNLSTTAKTIVAAINEVYQAIGTGGTASVVTVTELGGAGNYIQRYEIKHGGVYVGTINIPKELVSKAVQSDMLADDINVSLAKANTAYQKPTNGIPASDLADGAITADKIAEGYYPKMRVGYSDNLTGRGEAEEAMFTYRPTDGATSVESGVATIKRIKGNSVVFNQIAKEINSANWNVYNSNNASISFNSNIATVTVTNYASDIYGYAAGAWLIQRSSIIPNHKHLIAVEVKSDIAMDFGIELNSTYSEIGFVTNEWTYCTKIATSNSNYTRLIIGPRSPYTAELNTYSFRNLICIDLTQMFGAGNEPTTVEEFRALYPDTYYEYNEGTLQDLSCSGMETVGFNQWDGKVEVGYINDRTGNRIANQNYLCTDFIRVIPNQEYYINTEQTAGRWGAWYDANKNYIAGILNYDQVYTAPANAAYVRLTIKSADNGNPDTFCINLSHTGYRNGEYEEYNKKTFNFPLSEITNGQPLRKAGSVFDEINNESYIQRVGQRAFVEGDAEDATLFTDGTTTNYPLAEPIVTPIPAPFNLAYEVDDFGTERALLAEDSAPFSADIVYQFNAVDRIRANSQSIEELEESVNSLQAAVGKESLHKVSIDSLLEIGNIYFTGTEIKYLNTSSRVRLRRGVTLSLVAGDKIVSTSSDIRFFAGTSSIDNVGWRNGIVEYVIPSSGNWSIVMTDYPYEASTSTNNFAGNIFIKTQNYAVVTQEIENAVNICFAHNFDANIKSINHRGWGDAPENTLVAYRESRKRGFKYVECDVSFTSDNVAVLLHDSTIDRTSNGTGEISTMTYDEAATYDYGSWKSEKYAGEPIPKFMDFMVLCKNLGLHPYIELKSGTESQINNIIQIVNRRGMRGKVTYISFSAGILEYVVAADPKARVGLVCSRVTDTIITNAIGLRTETNEVFIDTNSATYDEYILCYNNEFPMEIWTYNFKHDVVGLGGYQYVTGVTSDYMLIGKEFFFDTMS